MRFSVDNGPGKRLLYFGGVLDSGGTWTIALSKLSGDDKIKTVSLQHHLKNGIFKGNSS